MLPAVTGGAVTRPRQAGLPLSWTGHAARSASAAKVGARVSPLARPTLLLSLALALVLARPARRRPTCARAACALSAGSLLDGNAPRDFSERRAGGPRGHGRGPAACSPAGEGRYTAERYQLVGRYDRGQPQVPALTAEEHAGAGRRAGGLARAGPHAGRGRGGAGQGQARRGARVHGPGGERLPRVRARTLRLAVRLRAGAHRFVYRPDHTARLRRPRAVGSPGATAWTAATAVTVSGECGQAPLRRRGRPRAGRRCEPRAGPARGRRARWPAWATPTGGRWRWGWRYAFQELASNSYGETVLRHRLSASAGVRLPAAASTLLAQGALVLNRYPDGVFLSPEIILTEDDEAQNSLSLRLVRPLSELAGPGALGQPLRHPPAAQRAVLRPPGGGAGPHLAAVSEPPRSGGVPSRPTGPRAARRSPRRGWGGSGRAPWRAPAVEHLAGGVRAPRAHVRIRPGTDHGGGVGWGPGGRRARSTRPPRRTARRSR